MQTNQWKMTQGKCIEHAYWSLSNISCKSLCWWLQLQDAPCMEETSHMYCSSGILVHSSNPAGTVCPFNELWALVLSTDFQLDSGQMIGYHSSSLIFSSLTVCLRSLPQWNIHPRFIFIINNVSLHFSSDPYMKRASDVLLKNSPTHDAHWNLQYFRKSSVISGIMSYNSKAAKVLRELTGFTVWHLRPSLGTEQADINLHQ